jgi:hypothetical protein
VAVQEELILKPDGSLVDGVGILDRIDVASVDGQTQASASCGSP